MDKPSLSELDNLAEIGKRNGPNIRPALLRILTDLYVQKLSHTADEERQYTDLALRLLASADVATRAAVSARLAQHLTPPAQVVQRLLADLPEIAAPLKSGPAVQSSNQTERIERHEPAMPPATNTIQTHHVSKAPAGPPRPIDPQMAGELNELFFAADANERRLILLNLNVVASASAGRNINRGEAVSQRLEAAALSHNRQEFANQLAQSLKITRDQARRIVNDNLGEAIAVAAKALGMRRDMIYRIFLFINPVIGHSVERVHALAELYDDLSSQAAEGIVAIWQTLGGDETAQGEYRPLHGGAERHPTAQTSVMTNRSPAQPRTGERRAS